MRTFTDMGGFPSPGSPMILLPGTSDTAPYNRVDYITAGAANTIIYLSAPAFVSQGTPLKIWKNGSLLFYGVDFTVSGYTITLNAACATADHFCVDWWSKTPPQAKARFQFLGSVYADILAASPQSFWKLGETTSTYADSGSNAFALTAGTGITRGSASIIPFQADLSATNVSGAHKIGGGTAGSAIIPLSATQDLTLIAFIKTTSLAAAQGVLHQGDLNVNGSQGILLEVTTAGALLYQCKDTAGFHSTSSSTGVVTANTAMMVACKLNGSAGSPTVSFYKNGSIIGSPNSYTFGTGNSSNLAFNIGCLNIGGIANSFIGTIQGVAIFTSIISDANLLLWAQDAGFA